MRRFWFAAFPFCGGAMKRESGENPGQTRCCEFHERVSDNPVPLSVSQMGRPSGTEQVRRPAKTDNVFKLSGYKAAKHRAEVSFPLLSPCLFGISESRYNECYKKTGMRRLVYIGWVILCCLFCLEAAGQNRVSLSGRVCDRQGEALGQVAIAVENTSLGTYTDDDGRYELPLPEGKQTVVFSCVGYQAVRRTLDILQDVRLDITLEEDAVSLQSVEVYGKTEAQQTREGAFAVNALDIRPIASSLNNLNDLINRTSGVKVRQEGGVGSDFDLTINGMSGNSVRYFIDGIPLDTKGSGVTLGNLPVNLIDRIEIYKGVVPASLGADALGGAVNIITKQEQTNYLDLSYGIGSFHTHKADLNAQVVEPKTGLIIRPTVGINYSKNDYMMKGVEVWDEESRKYLPENRRRFHDDYFSLLAQVEAGVMNKAWADVFFLSASYSKEDKELQTGSVQSKVYGMAERRSDAWNVSARYRKSDFLLEGLQLNALLSHTWDHSLTVDTAYRKYDWNGNYILSSRNEITGRGRSMRHYKRPLTIARANFDYAWNEHHSLNLNYQLSRTGNDRYDDVDKDFEASNDVLSKHIIGLSYQQSFFDARIENTFFVKDYMSHLVVRQTDLYWQTGSEDMMGSTTKNYWGGGAGTRFTVIEPFSLKLSYERSVRLPLARELLGNGTTIYANVALKPENSHNVNGGFFGTWHPARSHTFYYEVNGFMRYVDDYIQASVSEKEGMMQYENVPAVHIKGVEGEIRYDWDGRLQLSANASYQDARDQRKYKTDGKPSATYNNRVPNRPWLFGSAEACYTFRNLLQLTDRLRLGVSYQWVHWYFLTWEAYGARESKARIPAQHITNADITYSWGQGRYNISLECSNLFDRLAYDNYKLQKPGRAFFAKFRLLIH